MTTCLNSERYDRVLRLKVGDERVIEDHRGFPIHVFTETGDYKKKGTDVKL